MNLYKPPSNAFLSFFSLSQTLRQLSHGCRREAAMWKREGRLDFYEQNMKQASKYWEEAKWYFERARMLQQ